MWLFIKNYRKKTMINDDYLSKKLANILPINLSELMSYR